MHPEHPHYALAENALTVLRLRDEHLCMAPQNLIEFWAVATRPRNDNGLGMTVEKALAAIDSLRRFFRLLPYTMEVPEVLQKIVVAQGISGKQTHDAHIVAVMQVNSVAGILTFNSIHFTRFPGIEVFDPTQL